MGKKRKLVVLIVALVFLLQLPLLALTQAQAETEATTSAVTQAEAPAELEAETQAATQAEAPAALEAETQAEAHAATEAETQAETQSASETETPAETQSALEAETPAEPEVITGTATVAETPAALEAETQAVEGGGDFSQFITSVNVRVLDPDTGDELTAQPYPRNALARIEYGWTIPAGSVHEGDVYTFTIPSQFKAGAADGDLLDANGDVLATIHVDTDNVVTITFTNAVENWGDISGSDPITIDKVPFNEDELNTDPVVIKFPVGSDTTYVNVDMHFEQPPAQNTKSGVYDKTTNTITWTIKLNTNSTAVVNGILKDTIAPGGSTGQTYVPGSFTVTKADGTTPVDGTLGYDPAASDDTVKTGTLNYTFAETSFNEPVTITYKTQLTNPGQYVNGTTKSNTATFSHNDKTQTVNSSVNVPSLFTFTKSGSFPDTDNDKTIHWTLTFKSSGASLTNVNIEDTIPADLTLVDGSVELDGNSVSQGSATGRYTFANGTLTYHAGDITYPADDDEHTLTFRTSLPDDYFLTNHNTTEYGVLKNITRYNNSAKLTADDDLTLTRSYTVSPINTIISKDAAGYDKENHEIIWKITVNSSKRELPNAKVKDIIQAGQEYVPDSLVISPEGYPSNALTGDFQFKTGTESGKPTLEYDFGTINKATYTMIFRTRLTDQTKWAGNIPTDFSNDVSLTAGDSGDTGGGTVTNPNTSSTTGKYRADFDVIKKGVSYDYTNHELTWTATVNKNEIPLTNVVLEDYLTDNYLDDFDFEEGTVEVDGESFSSYTYDEDSKLLTINLGDLNSNTTSERKKIVKFKMKLNKTGDDYDDYFSENWSHTIKNTISMTSAENTTPSTATASTTVNNTMLKKTGNYKRGNTYIDWVVQVNQNRIHLQHATLTDELPAGLALDTSTVAVYRQNIAANGTLTPRASYSSSTGNVTVNDGVPITLTADNVDYDVATRVFTLKLPEGVGDREPFLVVFRTKIDSSLWGSSQTFNNTIELNETEYTNPSTPVSTNPTVVDPGGPAAGGTAKAHLLKVNAAGAPLEGAVFELYDEYNNKLDDEYRTDAEGSVIFKSANNYNLNYNKVYTIKEKTAPDDYVKRDDSWSFKINNLDNKVQLVKWDAGSSTWDEGKWEDDGTWTSGDYPIDPVVVDGVTCAQLPDIVDTLKTANVTLRKVDTDTSDALSGAEFKVYAGLDGSGGEAGFSGTTNADGTLTLLNIPYGDYVLRETTGPVDHEVHADIPLSLHDSNTEIVINGDTRTLDIGDVDDDIKTANVTLRKVDTDTGAGLAGAEFKVYAKDAVDDVTGEVSGEPVTSGTTNTDGTLTLSNIPYGDYVLRETTGPVDHEVHADIPLSLHDSNAQIVSGILDIGDVKDDIKTADVTLKKVDTDDTSKALAGAVFTLYAGRDGSGDEVAISNQTGDDGVATLSNIPYGDYVLRETTPAVDHELYVGDIPISLHDENESNENVDGTQIVSGILNIGNVEDDIKTANITLKKVDTDTGAGLAGAEFKVYAKDAVDDVTGEVSGEPVTSGTTNTDGTLTLRDIDYGDYVLRETKAPKDHEVHVDISFSLHDDQENTAIVDGDEIVRGTLDIGNVDDDIKTADITLKKVDTDTGDALAGAEFTLYDAEGKTVVSGVTINNGTLTLSDIPYGDYELRETEAPKDHDVHADIHLSLHDENTAIVINEDTRTLDIGNVDDDIKTADVTLRKVDADTGNALAGAEFTLYEAGGEKFVSGVTINNGTLTLSDIPYGDYELRETKAPDGYNAVDPITVSLHDENGAIVDDALDLGNVADTPLRDLPQTGDANSWRVGLVALCTAAVLAAAAAMCRLRLDAKR